MDGLVVLYRIGAIVISAFWMYWIVVAARQPADWLPPRADTFPFRVTRNLFLIGGVLGVIAGAVLFSASLLIFP